MAQVKWRCPKCRRVFEVSAGSEPIMCDDCQSAPVQSQAARAVQAGVPVQQATAPKVDKISAPLSLGLAMVAGWIIQAAGLITILAGIVQLGSGEPGPMILGGSLIGGGLSAINVAGIPAGLAWIGTLLTQRGP